MLGYFILKEDAEKFGLLNNPEIRGKLQETYFVVTNIDVQEITKRNVNPTKFDNISNFLNKNYYEEIVKLIVHLIRGK
jgi:mannitol-specific phosphotransferase system IIBC component